MLKVPNSQAESNETSAASPDKKSGRAKSRLLNPYLQLIISIGLTATSQILLKIGVDGQSVSLWYAPSILFSLWIWLGIVAVIGSLLSWLYALKSVPLIIAFNLAATNHILVAIASWLFLGEAISLRRWLGILVVAIGVFYIARPVARAEEKL
jgi:drug/metabolite transporter (DMT)-like permease